MQTPSRTTDTVTWSCCRMPTEMIPLAMTSAKYPGVRSRTMLDRRPVDVPGTSEGYRRERAGASPSRPR